MRFPCRWREENWRRFRWASGWSLSFSRRERFYRAVGQVRALQKREWDMLEIELKPRSPSIREENSFRFPCIMDMNYYTIEEQEAALKTGEALFIELQEAEGKSRDREYAGRIVDLSGGGIRFRTDQKLLGESVCSL